MTLVPFPFGRPVPLPAEYGSGRVVNVITCPHGSVIVVADKWGIVTHNTRPIELRPDSMVVAVANHRRFSAGLTGRN